MMIKDSSNLSMMRSALPVLFGFFLGFLLNTMIYVIPQYMDIREVMVSPARANISAQLSQIMPNSIIEVKWENETFFDESVKSQNFITL